LPFVRRLVAVWLVFDKMALLWSCQARIVRAWVDGTFARSGADFDRMRSRFGARTIPRSGFLDVHPAIVFLRSLLSILMALVWGRQGQAAYALVAVRRHSAARRARPTDDFPNVGWTNVGLLRALGGAPCIPECRVKRAAGKQRGSRYISDPLPAARSCAAMDTPDQSDRRKGSCPE
jgi:hypothetical protein